MDLASKARTTWSHIVTRTGRSDFKDDEDDEFKEEGALPPAVPAPPYRHAAPSGPWPWMDFNHVDFATHTTEVTVTTSVTPPDTMNLSFWPGYPQNLFGNWTPAQVERSQMLTKCLNNQSSTIYCLDVLGDGKFTPANIGMGCGTKTDTHQDGFWDILLGKRPQNIRVRSLFVDDLTPPVLRMLGTRYNIEPFFFTSSINWIPSRYQETPSNEKGDHITVTLPFVRSLFSKSRLTSPTPPASKDYSVASGTNGMASGGHSVALGGYSVVSTDRCAASKDRNTQINTQAPYRMHNGDMLFIDLLAIHMVRGVDTSTIISYHPESTWCQTSAKRLESLMQLVGDSVYWQIIFSKSKDPTFLFLAILWYALYAWDESFELLYNHVSELESAVLKESRIELTRDLHVFQAHLLHYQSLLHNFSVSVRFVENTPNPAMEGAELDVSKELMKKECENLIGEIDRLERRREMLSSRLKNVLDLAFATVNIEDSRQTRTLTEATVRDSASMRQISYLTMVFLPASFIASVFGMNVKEINAGSIETLAHYVETTISLTLLTVYVVVTLQAHSTVHREKAGFGERAAWPVLFLKRYMHKRMIGTKDEKKPKKSADDIV